MSDPMHASAPGPEIVRPRPALDASNLPSISFGVRDALWWGVVLLICTEAMMFGMLFATYFYVRGNEHVFPPTHVSWPTFWWGMAAQALMVLSALPMWWAQSSSRRAYRPGMLYGIAGAAIFAWLFVIARGFELHALIQTMRWDSNAYASTVWFLLVLHTFHGATSAGEAVLLLVPFKWKRLEKKHLSDICSTGLYWYFAVISGLVVAAIVYFDPAVLRTLR